MTEKKKNPTTQVYSSPPQAEPGTALSAQTQEYESKIEGNRIQPEVMKVRCCFGGDADDDRRCSMGSSPSSSWNSTDEEPCGSQPELLL